MKTERYEHHGFTVTVASEVKGKHREHCLCYSCEAFDETGERNCHMASAVYENCVKYNLVTPVYECPSYSEKKK